MPENESFAINDLMKTIVIISKNVKALSELVKTFDYKSNQPKSNNENDKDASAEARVLREKMDKIFAKKQIRRPTGSYDDKRQKYCEMINNNKIKQPKSETIEHYKLFENEEGKYEFI